MNPSERPTLIRRRCCRCLSCRSYRAAQRFCLDYIECRRYTPGGNAAIGTMIVIFCLAALLLTRMAIETAIEIGVG